MDDKWDCRHLGRDVTGLEEAQHLGRRVAISSKIVKAGLRDFNPDEYQESWDFNREKIPNLIEARKKTKEIVKQLGIQYE
jgi:non-homologous end joining protein Ku